MAFLGNKLAHVTSAGDTSAGDTSAGDTSAGDTSDCRGKLFPWLMTNEKKFL